MKFIEFKERMILNTQDSPLAQAIVVAPFRALLSSCAPISKQNNNQQGVDINREWESSCKLSRFFQFVLY